MSTRQLQANLPYLPNLGTYLFTGLVLSNVDG